MQQLTACVVEGQHAQVGRLLLLPYCFGLVQQYLQQQSADAAGCVALADAGSERCLQASEVASLAEQVLQTFTGLAALGQLRRRKQPQAVFQQLP